MTSSTDALLRTDGGARPTNPGHAGFASVVEINDEEYVISRYVGWRSNNVAEYFGVIVGIKYAHFLGATGIDIVSDSKLVVNQIKGEWRTKSEDLKVLAREARGLLSDLFPDAWCLEWEKRDGNKVADNYCTEAINWGRNQNPWVPASRKLKRPGKQRDPFASGRQFQPATRQSSSRVLATLLSTIA